MADDQTLKRFGARVRDLRDERQLSQEALAAQAGLHRNYVGSIERGERNAGGRTIIALADGLGVTPGDLFSFPGDG